MVAHLVVSSHPSVMQSADVPSYFEYVCDSQGQLGEDTVHTGVAILAPE
jgi:hypothetical protein